MTDLQSERDDIAESAANPEAPLRQRAEQAFAARQAADVAAHPAVDSAQLLHELQVHQIELEMQNEELRQAQEGLAALQARYFDLYDRAPVGYVTLSEKGLILEANLAATVLLGTTRRAAGMQTLTQFILPGDQDIYYRQRRLLLQTNEVQRCEVRIMRPDGGIGWVRLDMSIARDEAEGSHIVRVVLSDITERKRVEQEREQLQAQLAQARKMESIGRLAGGIAHDFNNMLAVIMIRTEMTLLTADPATSLHRNLTAIYETSQRSAGLVRQLLGYARKQTIAPIALDLNAAVAGTLAMLHGLIGEDLELAWHPGAALWSVKMDPSQIDQVLTNLCINARDAIQGVGAITIETANVTLAQTVAVNGSVIVPGDYVLLSVSDSGSGMESELLAHVFEPFFTTKVFGKGAGLGLATVDGIVQQNGGQIQVVSAPGCGTAFRIYLPRFGEEPPAPVAVVPQDLPRGAGETVLLVEDEATVLNMAVEALEFLGYMVLAATAPGEALHLATAHAGKLDLLITDIVMPEMNGRALAEQIAAIQPGIQRIYVSGYPADFVAHRGVLEAGVHFLQKPFTLQDLAAKVQEVLAWEPPVEATARLRVESPS